MTKISRSSCACARTRCSRTITIPSDLAWLDLKDPKIDVIFAPYETYMDGLLGVKASYGPAVLVRNEAESKKLDVFQQYVPEIQDALPLAAEDRPSKKGLQTPMEVVDAPYRAGDLRHGYQAVADNLPNDPRIHEAKGIEEDFLQELHGRARQLYHAAGGEAPDDAGSSSEGNRRRLPRSAR